MYDRGPSAGRTRGGRDLRCSAGGHASTSTAAGCGCRRGHTPGGSSRRTTAGRRGSARAATSRRNSRQASTGEVPCLGRRADRTARLRTACADGGIRRRGAQPAGERGCVRARHSEPARQQERVRVDDARSAGGAVAAAVQLQRIERRAEHRPACRLGKRRKPNDDRPADERVRCSATASVRHQLPLRRRQRHHRHVRLREHSSRSGARGTRGLPGGEQRPADAHCRVERRSGLDSPARRHPRADPRGGGASAVQERAARRLGADAGREHDRVDRRDGAEPRPRVCPCESRRPGVVAGRAERSPGERRREPTDAVCDGSSSAWRDASADRGLGNWCGSRRTIRLAVSLGGSTTRAPFSTLPVCLQPRQRSRLSVVH